jgi:hypothetical protein
MIVTDICYSIYYEACGRHVVNGTLNTIINNHLTCLHRTFGEPQLQHPFLVKS